MKHKAVALVVASGLSLTPMWADAAGLGKITVYSALGQPLRAEIQIAATRDELLGMTARLAPDEAFKQANVDHYSQSLSLLRFSVEKRGKGAVVKVSSSKPINDPFLDFLVELDWPSGRLVREYTFLLDPPEVAAAQAAAAQRLPVTTGTGISPAAASQRPAQPSGSAGEHVVKTGENLHGIAADNLSAGVSLDQMLVAIYRNNTDAFIGNNMNRLRSGAVLQIPAAAEAAAIPEKEARRVFQAQVSEWNSYRRRLAESAKNMGGDVGNRTSVGKIDGVTPPSPQPPTDVVKVSPNTQGITEADWLNKEKEIAEYKSRVADLEKNVSKLEGLLKAKEQTRQAPIVAPSGQQSATPRESKNGGTEKSGPKSPKSEDTEPAVEPVAPVIPEPVVEPVGPPVGSVEISPVEVGGELEGPPAPSPVADNGLESSESAPVEEESSDLGLLIGGGGAVLAAALGVVLFLRRRKPEGGEAAEKDVPTRDLRDIGSQRQNSVSLQETTTEIPSDREGILESNSVFQTSGGQSVNTVPTIPPVSSFSSLSVNGPGVFDLGEVDPINEADLYLAYNKDAQAEEILLDALQKDPERMAISVKLLEVYAQRKNVKQFEALASELNARTGGQGDEWAKVVTLGRELDPENPLYGGTGSHATGLAGVGASDSGEELPFEFETRTEIDPKPLPDPSFDFGTETNPNAQILPPSLPEEGTESTVTDSRFAEAATANFNLSSTDFDLGNFAAEDNKVSLQPASGIEKVAPAGFGEAASHTDNLAKTPAKETFSESELGQGLSSNMLTESGLLQEPEVEFEANLTESTVLGNEALSGDFFSGLDLELGGEAQQPPAPVEPPPAPKKVVPEPPPAVSAPPLVTETRDADAAAGGALPDSRRDEVNTKLELAQAYEDMGDLEGARELLNEILSEGAPDQVAQAKEILGRLGA